MINKVNEMIKEDLKFLDIKIKELADYLNISRPTLYSFIQIYEGKEYSKLDERVLNLFKYIDSNKMIEKRNVIHYILTKMQEGESLEDSEIALKIQRITDLIRKNPNSEKVSVLDFIVTNNCFDTILHYLFEIKAIISKKRLSLDEKRLIEPYNKIIDLYTIKVMEEQNE